MKPEIGQSRYFSVFQSMKFVKNCMFGCWLHGTTEPINLYHGINNTCFFYSGKNNSFSGICKITKLKHCQPRAMGITY